MRHVQDVNLQDLLRGPRSASIGRAEKLLTSRGDDEHYLAQLLRDYREEPIESDRETRQRDDIDNLISLYSLVEVAAICRFVPYPLPNEFCVRARSQLELPAVFRFFTEFHPQLLPQSFLLRVQGRDSPTERDGDDLAPAFVRFHDTTREFEADEDVEWLLTFLDDYVIDGHDWNDVKGIIQNPKSLVRVLTAGEEDDSVVVSAVVGYSKFVAFTLGFHGLLQDLSARPVMQSALWHYYAYWFEHLKYQLGPAWEKSLNGINALVIGAREGLPDVERADAVRGIEYQRAVVKDLLSRRYGIPLATAVADLRARLKSRRDRLE